jgi:hypothetical protein
LGTCAEYGMGFQLGFADNIYIYIINFILLYYYINVLYMYITKRKIPSKMSVDAHFRGRRVVMVVADSNRLRKRATMLIFKEWSSIYYHIWTCA